MMRQTCRRQFVLFIAFCLLPSGLLPQIASSQEPTVHAVIIGDTSPAAGWGALAVHITADTVGMYASLANGLPESQFRYYPLSLEDDQWATPDNIMSYLAEVNVRPNDTLLFYYSGHGAADDKGHYFHLAGGKLYRDDVRRAMETKSARLNVLLSDCCNLREDGFSYFAPGIRESPPLRAKPIFEALLLRPTGWVDLNASSPGEGAFFGSDDPEKGGFPGSLFTTALLNLWENQSNTSMTWDEAVDHVRVDVYLAFRQTYPKGAAPEAGFDSQTQQNVYAYSYPGMPPRTGPRTGMTVRNHSNPGALIVRAQPDSPATHAFDVAKQTFVSLQPGQNIVRANDTEIQRVEDLVAVAADSPQLMRLMIQNTNGTASEFLISLSY
ncbi:caspase family protein [Aporhodopirellula aestuarii]|uniref:Caspase family protein n=1 Tax=Aporhodopirellula aestuarii TaxID=2950107 RepID=A0ABT0UE18_9BACT|nr:caspase family protein [Aporhodopirellula aestuarii]MCM2375076.1 caspase family protein [Aporhodopirellula aestuarii]